MGGAGSAHRSDGDLDDCEVVGVRVRQISEGVGDGTGAASAHRSDCSGDLVVGVKMVVVDVGVVGVEVEVVGVEMEVVVVVVRVVGVELGVVGGLLC